MTDKEFIFELVELKDGTSSLIKRGPSVGVTVGRTTDVVRRTRLDISHEEFVELLKKTPTHNLAFSEGTGRVIATSRNSSTVSTKSG